MSIAMQAATGLTFGALMLTLQWRLIRSEWWRRNSDVPVAMLLRRRP